MKMFLKRRLLFGLVVIHVVVSVQLIHSSQNQESGRSNKSGNANRKSQSYFRESSVERQSLSEEEFFGKIIDDLKDAESDVQVEISDETDLVRQLNEGSVEDYESRVDEEKLVSPKDVDGGLVAAASIEAAATDGSLTSMTTFLEKLRKLVKFGNVLSDISMYETIDWFEQDDHPPRQSRVRRVSEPYSYRRFQQPLRAYVPENSPVGTFVLEIPRNYDGPLEIVSPENPVFRLNSQTGILETVQRLDYEKQKVYSLIIRDARDNTPDSPFYSHDVIIYIVDVNDNAPMFNMQSYAGQVNSGSRVGSPVAELNATDSDGGPRGRVGFSVDDRDSPFTVNPKTWILETNGKRLDPSLFQFPVNVRTFDQGYPRRNSPVVVINVNKANNPPRFSQNTYSFRFSEKTLPGVVIGHVVAKSLSSIPVGYEVVPTSNVYKVDDRGELTLKRSLDFESAGTSRTSVIVVKAMELTVDNPLSSQVSVTLVVTNDNENPTTFIKALYDVGINEDASPGSLITTVAVTDCDCASDCRCNGSEVIFSLSDTDGYFVVNGTGEIHSARDFSYVVKNVFEFMVTAQDKLGDHGNTMPARAYVVVRLRDVNNNAPRFAETGYHFDVDEDAGIGHLVGAVQATDNDTTESPLTYRIKESVPSGRAFAMTDQRFGIISVASSLKVETESTFMLTVEASDGVHTSETNVEIHVDDVNDNAPQFTTCPKFVRLEENLSEGARVTVLKAVDSDRGKNGLVEYFLEKSFDLFSSDHRELFVVNNETGEVKTAVPLDRETQQYYFVIASARDQIEDSEVRQVGYCQFVVNVTDENDNYPTFGVARYQTSVRQDASVGTRILKVEATDADIGANSQITYSIAGGNELFQISLDGWITVKSGLNGKLGMKAFTVTAGNTQPYHALATADETRNVTVEILVTDQAIPRFTQVLFQASVREDSKVGTTVLNVSAVASPPERGVLYYLADMRPSEFPFRLDPVSGAIQVGSQLNYEFQRRYVSSVIAHEVGRSELVEAGIEINVVDVNDVSPIFGRDRYDATVSEGAAIGTVVLHIRAADPDPADVNITYAIQESEDSGFFQLRRDDTSVDILTNAKFDRENREYYNVILVANDNGDPQLSSTAYVTVRVLDENDSPPVFDTPQYSVSVPENTPVGQIVETVVTRDKDHGKNARALFFIAAGNDGRFQMTSEQATGSSRGYLVITRPLDYEANSEYNLTVVASDEKFSATAIIRVTVTNADDDAPFFERPLYNTTLPENTAPGTLVLVVKATDDDSPADRLVYSLDPVATPNFVIGSSTGAITTSATPLDREQAPVVVFPVTVTDGTNKARTFVEIIVLDVNEPPQFPDSPYIGFVQENQPVGTAVRYVTAFDDDDPKIRDGMHANITYSIDRNSERLDEDGRLFTIDPASGLLRTNAVLNLEVIRRNLTIQVRATDGGNPRLSAVTLVTIVVEDVSEFPPKFADSTYNVMISEDAPLGQNVLTLSAVDEDFTPIGHQYSITDGNYPFAFYVNPHTGEILVAGILDYETKKEYNLTVSLSERGISKTFQSDTASVLITILDANDQPPVFQPKTYYRKISEDAVLGTEVRVITCSDRDSGPNAVPRFSITSGDVNNAFDVISHPVDKNLGVVQVAGRLDMEKKPSYSLEITATDIGGLSDTATLAVELEDVNDTPPTFIPSYYEGSILGGVRKEQRVLMISVTDSDQAPNGGPFTFTLKSLRDKFQLKDPQSRTVELHTNLIEFDRETTPLYEVRVEATDGGSPAQSAEAVVYVNVVDSSVDREAFDGSMTIIVYALNRRFGGGTIGYVYYKDDDYEVDKNDYVITSQEPGSYFTVDATTGRIRCAANIPVGAYSLVVNVREKNRASGQNAGKTVTSTIQVLVRSVNETAVQHAVALRFPLRNPALFVDAVYLKLVEKLAEIFRVSSDDIYVFSIHQSSGSVAGLPYGVDVWIAIGNPGDDYLNPSYVFAQLELNYDKLTALGTEKLEVGYDKCASEAKSVGVCRNVLTAQKSFSVYSGYYGQVPAPSSSLTVVAIVTELHDVYDALPEPARDCRSMPCKNGGTCHDVLPEGYVCECPPGFRGPECQATTRTFDRPDSYIWLEPIDAFELSSISFEFMSQPNIANGLLLYQGPLRQDGNNGVKDFLAVSLVNGFIKVTVSLGGRPSSLELRRGDRLDDGMWHHVEVKRVKKVTHLIVDHCESATTTEEEGRYFEHRASCEVVSKSFENFIYLNGLGSLQIGGSSFAHPSITSQSFFGCIRNIYDNNKMYDLHNPLKVLNAPIGCDRGCARVQCQNGGYCEVEVYYGSTCCTCPAGFTGCDCSERSPSLWYLKNSFSEYNTSSPEQGAIDPPSRRRRQIFPAFFRSSPSFYTDLVFRLRISADVSNAVFFRTSSPSGVSFSELGVKNKQLYYTFKFADEVKTVTLPGVSISDNKWHTIQVKRQGNTASLQLDYKAKSYGTTGGIVRLVDYTGGPLYIGGSPRLFTRHTDLGGNGSLGSLDDGRKVGQVEQDFQGCTSGTVYNGNELDKRHQFNRFHVVNGCPCTAVVECKNNGTCVDEDPPYCVCSKGFTGATCEELVVTPTLSTGGGGPVIGLRSTARHRLLDPVWICVFLMSLITLIFLLCLLRILPVVGGEPPLIEEDAHDSIMAYQEHGSEEKDTADYDITLLRQRSRRHVTSLITRSAAELTESGNYSTGAVDGLGEAQGEAQGEIRGGSRGEVRGDADRVESWIMRRVTRADRDVRFFPKDEMKMIRDEGKYWIVGDLSELEIESEDEVGEHDIDVFAIDWDNFVK